MRQIMRLPPMPTIGDLIKVYRLGAKKKLSQNFLLDLNLTDKIVRKMSKTLEGHHVLEVGPGPGGITRSVLEAGVDKLTVVELDKRFIPILEILNQASGGKLEIHNDDVMKFPTESVFPTELGVPWESAPPNLHIVGNLPFSVSTPLIIKWLKEISEKSGAWSKGRVKLTLTFQKEVAERMTASTRGVQRSRLSIMSQTFCDVDWKFTIPGKAFVPQPDVDVAVVTFTPLVTPLMHFPFPLIEKVVRHVFHYRQKMCKRGIQTLFPPNKPEFASFMLSHANISPEKRPIQLTIGDFRRLCSAYEILCQENDNLFNYNYRSPENSSFWKEVNFFQSDEMKVS